MRVAVTSHVGARFRERDRDCLAQPSRSARHQSDSVVELERIKDAHERDCAFEVEPVITRPLMTPITTPIAAPSAMSRNRLDPDTRESSPKHQPANDPKILPMNPKPTIVPIENGLTPAPSRSSTGSSLGTNKWMISSAIR